MTIQDGKKYNKKCLIKIEDSIVLVFCCEVNIDKVRSYLQAYEGIKGNKEPVKEKKIIKSSFTLGERKLSSAAM